MSGRRGRGGRRRDSGWGVGAATAGGMGHWGGWGKRLLCALACANIRTMAGYATRQQPPPSPLAWTMASPLVRTQHISQSALFRTCQITWLPCSKPSHGSHLSEKRSKPLCGHKALPHLSDPIPCFSPSPQPQAAPQDLCTGRASAWTALAPDDSMFLSFAAFGALLRCRLPTEAFPSSHYNPNPLKPPSPLPAVFSPEALHFLVRG